MKKYRLIREYPNSPILGSISYNIGTEKRTGYVTTVELPNGHKYFTSTIIDYEKYIEYWQEIVEKEYEILSLRNKKQPNYIYDETDKSFNVYIEGLNGHYNFLEIYSVKRLSDGE